MNEDTQFTACDACCAEGSPNALYMWDEHGERHIACPVHGEISDQRKAEYAKAGMSFLIGRPVFEGSLYCDNEDIP